MKDLHVIRRENLVKLMDKHYGGQQASIARAIGVPANLVSRWISGKNIGDKSARKIEDVTRQTRNWLDIDHDNMLIPEAPVDEIGDIGVVAASNLRSWMDHNPPMRNQSRISRASGVGQSTIARFLDSKSSISISTLEAIANAFERHGYELLISPSDPEIINYDKRGYAKLSAEDKKTVEEFIQFMIDKNANA
ncbi:helix-turn-helix domain-containing protein [Pectobacterium aroidearum]|uniref:helix-turn-helix domain-containing protein n=1 Tax=Pectobacterium aroidearum TaxID=1201031 RepID=UPI001CD58547|nr:helix-turn-helix transcriptional regulator [Pectobacterium aroidearum]